MTLPKTFPPYSYTTFPTERFGLVPFLYGPGNPICWFSLMNSALVSGTLDPSYAKQDSVTNKFVAVL
jgi:hypothetical protein